MERRSSGTAGVLGILFLAGAARLLSVGAYEFDPDNADSAYLALQFLAGGPFPLHSRFSTFFIANPPGMSYLQMLPLAIWRSPYAVVISVVLLNTLGVLFVYRLARDVAGPRAALVAGLLFALAPWIVHFSRRSWHPGLYPLLVPATGYFLIRALRARRDRATPPLLAGMACFGLLINRSLIGYLAIPQLLATLWLGRRRFRPQAVAAGAGLLLLMSVPYAAGPWSDRASVLERLGQYWSKPTRADLDALRHAVRLVSGHLYPRVFFNDGSAAVGTLSTAAEVAHWLLTSALFVGMVLSLRDGLGGRDPHGVHRALLAWLVLPILLLTAHRNLVYPRYLMITIKALPRSPLAA